MKELSYVTLDKLNNWLSRPGYKFMGGEHLSIADFQVFQEVLNSVKVLGMKLDGHPKVHDWFNKCSENA